MSTSLLTLRSAIVPRSTALTHALFIVGGTTFLALAAQVSFTIPGTVIPFSGQSLAVLLVGTTYGARLGFATFATYLLAGIAGAPIFAHGGYGYERIISATGGYLVGMFLATALLGYLAERRADRKFITSFPALLLGEVTIFSFGLVWLHHTLGYSWSETIADGLTPFIIPEIIKIAIVATSLPLVWQKISTSINK